MILAELNAASFRGVGFLCPSHETEEGRKTILHEPVQSNRRYAEDTGYCPPKFTMPCVVHGPNAIGRLNALRNALNRPGPGTLIHPEFGPRLCAVVGPYKIKREDTDLGVYTIEVTFAVTGGPVFPGLVSALAGTIDGLTGGAISAIVSAFEAAYGSIAGDITLATVAAAIGDITDTAVSVFGSVEAVRSIVDSITAAPSTLAADPARFGEVVTVFGTAPFTANLQPAEVWRGYVAMAGVADAIAADAAAIEPYTFDLAERRRALDEIATLTAGMALVGLVRTSAARVHVSADEPAAELAVIVERFASLSERNLAPAAVSAMGRLLAEAGDVLAARQVTLPEIVSIDVAGMPASVLAYMLYDSDAAVPTLIGLNAGQDPRHYEPRALVLRSRA